MTFELTDKLIAEILFAMENQQKQFLFDAKKMNLISFDESLVDNEVIYLLPSWDSSDGYNLLETFITKFSGVKPYKELKNVLAEGRGVFKNFKKVLKKYPEVERKFNLYKKNEMNFRIIEWYNSLRESWGLEKLNQEYDDCNNLIQEDFIFRPYDYKLDRKCLALEFNNFLEEIKNQFPGELGFVLSDYWKMQSEIKNITSNKSVEGFVCHTLLDEFAGCILYSSNTKEKKIVAFAALFVNQNYRGLGIAKELLDRSLSFLRDKGINFFIISNSFVSNALEPLLVQFGFEKKGFAFVTELN